MVRKDKNWFRDHLIQQARFMRSNPTQAEAALWYHLRKRRLGGLRFLRQRIFFPYIVDFYCAQAKMIIEIDGLIHLTQKDYDHERDDYLNSLGCQVIHFSNQEVLDDTEMVLSGIYDTCKRRIERKS